MNKSDESACSMATKEKTPSKAESIAIFMAESLRKMIGPASLAFPLAPAVPFRPMRSLSSLVLVLLIESF